MPEVNQLMALGMPWGLALQTGQSEAGASGGYFGDQGNLFLDARAATNPASTGGDIVMAAFSLPGLLFDQPGRSVAFEGYGSTASVTNARTVKIIVGCTTAVVGTAVTGGTTIASITSSATAGSGGWFCGAQMTKYGIQGANTQIAVHFAGQMGSVAIALVAPQALTLTENAGILCALTVNAATTATDASYNMFLINMMN
jgi:hypothetical protein